MTNRHIYQAHLRPVIGSTFQPTGFPDIGAATFDRWDPETQEPIPSLLLESTQSMANRLEATCWDTAERRPISVVEGLPYVESRSTVDDRFLTSSRLEPHRLASPYVREAKLDNEPMGTVMAQRFALAPDTPLNMPHIAREVLKIDPFCLLHGVFFNNKVWTGQPRFTRAVTAVIEAHDVRSAAYGGLKTELVRRQNIQSESEGRANEGYGNIPYQRLEWTARTITASFTIDAQLLRSYGLPEPAADLLETIAMYEIRSFLTNGLRLRTACDLEPVAEPTCTRGTDLPGLDELSTRIPKLVSQLGDELGDGKPMIVAYDKA